MKKELQAMNMNIGIMLNRLLILLIAIAFVGGGNLFGQLKIEKKELKGEWFISNLDSNFYKSDTLIMFKKTNISDNSYKKPILYIEPESELVGTRLNVYFNFNNFSKASVCKFLGYASTCNVGPIRWKLKGNVITIKSNFIDWKFEVITKDTIDFKYKYGYTSNPDTLRTYSTLKWQIVRLK